jgi:hypothetical protein
MRLILLAVILLLALTLVNALMFRQEMLAFHHTNWVPVHLGIKRESRYGWDLFIWREIAAIVVTAVAYGIAASLTQKRTVRRR